MKNSILILCISAFLFACKSNTENAETTLENAETAQFLSIGDSITNENVLDKEAMAALYNDLKSGDTVTVKFATVVKEVCQNKGCWMTMDLGEKEAMVKFKDYAFFMPKDLAGKEVILNGKAFIEEMSVDEQIHYAEDAGKSEDEIAGITETKRTLSFLSDGVLIPQ